MYCSIPSTSQQPPTNGWHELASFGDGSSWRDALLNSKSQVKVQRRNPNSKHSASRVPFTSRSKVAQHANRCGIPTPKIGTNLAARNGGGGGGGDGDGNGGQ